MTFRGVNRYDRPVVRDQPALGHTSSFALSQQQKLPPGRGMTQQELPPRAAPRAVTLLTHTNSFQLPLQQVLPPGKSERTQLPPISQRRNLADWQDYILPWAQGPPSRPLNQTDWPNPSGPRPLALGHSDSFKLPLQQVIQPNQYDWPLPRGPQPLVRDWSGSFALPQQQVLPPRQTDWPVPATARRNPQDWIEPTNIALVTSVAGTPFSQDDWPNPRGPTSNQLLAWRDGLLIDVLPPPANYDWPNPLVARRNPQDWIQQSFAPPAPAQTPPLRQSDWPNPRGKLPVVADWSQQALPLQPSSTQLPFSQTDWPLPSRIKVGGQDWSYSFKLPQQQTLPPRQLDWPVPRGRVSYDLRGFTQRGVILPPAATPPNGQRDWPNPRGPAQPVITARDFTHGVVPPNPPVFDSDLTLKNEIVRLRYLDHASGRVRFLKNEVRS